MHDSTFFFPCLLCPSLRVSLEAASHYAILQSSVVKAANLDFSGASVFSFEVFFYLFSFSFSSPYPLMSFKHKYFSFWACRSILFTFTCLCQAQRNLSPTHTHDQARTHGHLHVRPAHGFSGCAAGPWGAAATAAHLALLLPRRFRRPHGAVNRTLFLEAHAHRSPCLVLFSRRNCNALRQAHDRPRLRR